MKVLAIKNRGQGAHEVIFDADDDVYFRPGQLEALTAYLTRPPRPTPQERAHWLISGLMGNDPAWQGFEQRIAAEIRAAEDAARSEPVDPIAHG